MNRIRRSMTTDNDKTQIHARNINSKPIPQKLLFLGVTQASNMSKESFYLNVRHEKGAIFVVFVDTHTRLFVRTSPHTDTHT